MPDIITNGAAVIMPTLVLGYESSRSTRSVVHDIISRADPEATLRVAGLRTGRLSIGFIGASAESDSASAESVLATAAVFTLTSTDRPSIVMKFVLPATGRLSRVLDDVTRDAWSVSFDWQEVAP